MILPQMMISLCLWTVMQMITHASHSSRRHAKKRAKTVAPPSTVPAGTSSYSQFIAGMVARNAAAARSLSLARSRKMFGRDAI